jgi:V/A-type H+/Na+-transporting ATPase subunit E
MMKNQENLEGIVSKLKEQGVYAGETEKKRLIDAANRKVEKMLADAEAKSKKIIEKAEADAAQIEKNSRAAISQAARDMVEATKIAITNHLKKVFGNQCESIINQEEYLKALLKAVLETIQGDKTVEVSPEQVEKMQSFIASSALKEGIEIKPLAKSEAKISVSCKDNEGIQFVITSKDIEDGLFSLLNQDLLERISSNKED